MSPASRSRRGGTGPCPAGEETNADDARGRPGRAGTSQPQTLPPGRRRTGAPSRAEPRAPEPGVGAGQSARGAPKRTHSRRQPGGAGTRPSLPREPSRGPRGPQSPWAGRPRPRRARAGRAHRPGTTRHGRAQRLPARRLPAAPAEGAGARALLPASRAVDPAPPRPARRSRQPQGAENGSGRAPCGAGPRGHFRPSAAWPRAGSAHAQRPMELPESGPGLRCRGEPTAEAALARLSTQACESGDTKTSKEGPVPRMCPLTER